MNEADEGKEEDRDGQGCFSLLFFPITVAIAAVLLLLSGGFLVHMLVQFESNQVKVIWLGSSILAGLVVYMVFTKIKKRKKERRKR